MKIKFNRKSLIEVVESFDEETETCTTSDETFQAGDIVEGDLLEDFGERINFQFGDGSVVFGLYKKCFEIIEK
jgi:hypothetical protein